MFPPLHKIPVEEYNAWAEKHYQFLQVMIPPQNGGDGHPIEVSLMHPVIKLRLAHLLAKQAGDELAAIETLPPGFTF